MKTKIFSLLSFLSFTFYFTSCLTSKQDNIFYNSEILDNCTLVPGTINVTVNHIKDYEIENSLRNMISVKNNLTFSKSENICNFNITVVERTFTENYETKYSSFIYTSITDNENDIVFENCSYRKNKTSIISSTYLNSCIQDIYSNLTKYADRKKK